MNRYIVLGLASLAIGAALVGAALGWFGGVVVCGADQAPGCVTWRPAVALLVWLAFVVGVAALVACQVRYLHH